MAPASFSTLIAQPPKVRIAGRLCLVISIERFSHAETNCLVPQTFPIANTRLGFRIVRSRGFSKAEVSSRRSGRVGENKLKKPPSDTSDVLSVLRVRIRSLAHEQATSLAGQKRKTGPLCSSHLHKGPALSSVPRNQTAAKGASYPLEGLAFHPGFDPEAAIS